MPDRSALQANSRPIMLSVGRGIRCTCPNCGEGKLFSGYLQQNARCQKCDEPLGRYDAGLLTALLVGLIIVLPRVTARSTSPNCTHGRGHRRPVRTARSGWRAKHRR
ncbi:MAG: DUF983 domain-containing protein [Alphaproteobacteria bacterium]|nr:DUF983 domain-containing protein [Alphaproteobacteria bacterium]